MSIVLEYQPKYYTKKRLYEYLISEQFTRTKYIQSSYPKGSIYLSWFEEESYRSFDGVQALIYQINDQQWAIQIITRAHASAYDIQKQNEVIRKARKQFSGDFINDCFGKNRYTPINEKDFFSPIESGIIQLTDKIKEKLTLISQSTYKIDDSESHKYISIQNRPSNIFYNSLIPFLVASIESFFKELFIVLIEFDELGKSKLNESKVKTNKKFDTIGDIADMIAKKTKLEREIANGLNFQNLENVNEIFKKNFNLDIKSFLHTKKRVYNKVIVLYTELDFLIKRRHILIHHFGFSNDMDREKFVFYLNLVNTIINVIIDKIESSKKLKITENSYYQSETLI